MAKNKKFLGAALLVVVLCFLNLNSVNPESVSEYLVDNLVQKRNQVQEEAARATLSAIRAACEAYKSSNGQYPDDLQVLAQAKPPYISSNLVAGEIQGYKFYYSRGAIEGITCIARPSVKEFNMKTFRMDYDGNIIVLDGQKQ